MNKVLKSTSKARSASRENDEDYHTVLEKSGMDNDTIQQVEKNMILFKSLANIKDQRKKMAAKMSKAQNAGKIKSKVHSTRPHSAMMTRKGSPRKKK